MAEAVKRFSDLTRRIGRAAETSGRDPAAIRLIAVSKTYDAETILPLLEAGHRDFGENRVQEALAKWPPLKERFPDLRLHLIGPLQTNKLREAVAFFDAIHSLDREKLAGGIAKELVRQERAPELFVQVNTGEEPQKAGIRPQVAAEFVRRCHSEHRLPVSGLMCLPPAEADPVPHFEMLASLAAALGLQSLSMGMSADFEAAIAHGATHLRVGSAIFGARS